MRGDCSNEQVVGRCSLCGGVVVVSLWFLSVVAPIPYCKNCGAIRSQEDVMPVIPMTPVPKRKDWTLLPENDNTYDDGHETTCSSMVCHS